MMMRCLVTADDGFEFLGHDVCATRLNNETDQHRRSAKNQGSEIKDFFHRSLAQARESPAQLFDGFAGAVTHTPKDRFGQRPTKTQNEPSTYRAVSVKRFLPNRSDSRMVCYL
jgi:hypothetical protein